jgi:hypothetical protein
MKKKITGAWIIHHCRKLQGVTLATQDYEQIGFAGKCGTMLNALAGTQEVDVTMDRVQALAKANGISTKLELPSILQELQRQRLIDQGKSGIAVLGLTTAQTLQKTATIFDDSSPTQCEKAALDVAEKVSELPVVKNETAKYVSDTFHLQTKDTEEILNQCKQIGFFDAENISGQDIYFNGNLFRREDIVKINAVLSSLSSDEERKVNGLSAKLKSEGCIPKPEAVSTLNKVLYSKLCSIGFIDENRIGNESGTFSFITQPASFSKFTDSAADDAFDLAKAFVTSLTYGMTSSSYSRGRIIMIEALMRKLIDGSWVGPATAIGQDYKVLEVRGVLEVKPSGDGRFYMRLLKKEVGQLALVVITEGEASGETLLQMPSVSATKYHGPEENRVIIRRKQTEPLRTGVAKLLSDLRTGGIR